MAIKRPTFSESWYRVAQLQPRLRSTVQIHRQHYRGQIWHILQDPTSNQFFRLNRPAYHFVAMLDGRHTIADVWQTCNETQGDDAPTQGEVIQLLGQLYTTNLLQADLPPDAEGLFQRFRKRRRREVQGYLMNLLFVRIPLIDPEHFLNRWVAVFGKIFTWYGFAVWLVLLISGLYFIGGHVSELADRASGVLNPDNLVLLYLSFAVIKVLHEFGHGFACKKFGLETGGGGEVHVMGIMLLVFTPVPYVDASSAWALRNKWHRVVVGAAGMMIELAVAAIAAIVWANTGQGSTIHAICYNVMFVAGVSTLLFNGNPLLRYDAYYILCDLLEMPNLSQRSKEYLYYLVKRYAWKVKQARDPSHTKGERPWLVVYAIASTIYRVIICVSILMFIADKLFILGTILAAAAIVAWVGVPLGKFVHYLFTSNELIRHRRLAMASTAGTLLVTLGCLGFVPIPDRYRAEGVVEPTRFARMYAGEDGFVESSLPSGTQIEQSVEPITTACNPDLLAEAGREIAERQRLIVRRRLAQTEDQAAAQILTEQIVATNEKIARLQQRLDRLNAVSPVTGTWISPEADRLPGSFVRHGDPIGMVASLDEMIIRATAAQDIAAILIDESEPTADMRLRGRPDDRFAGTIEKIVPAGLDELPSAALGYGAGGSMEISPTDDQGRRTAERFFEIHIAPHNNDDIRLLSGQRVIVRFTTPTKPLIVQWWRDILRVIQRRFHI